MFINIRWTTKQYGDNPAYRDYSLSITDCMGIEITVPLKDDIAEETIKAAIKLRHFKECKAECRKEFAKDKGEINICNFVSP